VSGYAALARLLDARRLRALSLALRTDLGAVGRDHGTDPDLVALAERPFASVADAHDRLCDLETRLRAAGDRRAVFLTVYTRMTATVRDAVDDGSFADPAWMRRYTATFADYYRRAFLAFERGDHAAVPDPWRVAFGTAVAGEGLVVQDALLGINAHITYDLALTLHEVGIDPDRARKHADHRRIDDVLAGLVDAQQAALAELYAPGVADLDASLGRLDERLSLVSMTEGRSWAWRVATVLTDVEDDIQVVQEEIFAPVLAVIPFASEAEANALVNDTDYGSWPASGRTRSRERTGSPAASKRERCE